MQRLLSFVALILLFGITGKAQQQVSISTAKTAAINSMRYNRHMYSEADIDTVHLYVSGNDTVLYEVKFNDNHSVLLSGSKAMAFPNPTKGELNIDISNLPKNLENRVSITDVSGMTRMCRIIQGSGNLLTIDVSSLEPGAYLYSVYNKEKELFNGKFVKE